MYTVVMRQITLIAHNLRSAHNVGSLLRTADGLGVQQVVLSGYTPHPKLDSDERLPHIAIKTHKAIIKTSLGAETTVQWRYAESIEPIIAELKNDGWVIAAVEQSLDSIQLPVYTPPDKIVLLVGREVEGIEPEILKLVDLVLEIPMLGNKESFNVAQAAAIAMYHCRYYPSN